MNTTIRFAVFKLFYSLIFSFSSPRYRVFKWNILNAGIFVSSGDVTSQKGDGDKNLKK